MANEFKIVWENNPETPLSAENLSKFINNYSEGTILLKDTDEFISPGFGDNLLKIRANSKVSMIVPETNAFFEFNDSYISHDSKIIPSSKDNLTFRKEKSNNDISSRSIAIERGTTNFVSNSSFENNLTSWDTTILNPESTINIIDSEDSIFGANSLEIKINASGDKAEISQVVPVLNNSDPLSISFYYKSDEDLKVIIEGNHETTSIYWSISADQWSTSAIVLNVPKSDEWSRFEVKNISTTSLIGLFIKLHIYSDSPNSTNIIDDIQVEANNFCSSYVVNNRQNSNFHFNSSIINSEAGLLDFQVMLKCLDDEEKYLFVARTSDVLIDSMRLFIDSINTRLVFSVYDYDLMIYRTVIINYSVIEFANLLNNWTRIICTWNTSEGITLYSGEKSSFGYHSFVAIPNQEITEIQIGYREDVKYLNGLIDSLKFNFKNKDDDKILLDLLVEPKADFNNYKFFENLNSNIILNEQFLDTESNFNINTQYFVWIYINSILDDFASIVISESHTKPSIDFAFSKIIGGFKTDSNGNSISDSLWDIRSNEKKVLHTERLIVHGRDSNTNNIEFRSSPYGLENDAQFNVVTRFTNNLYGNNGSIDFLDINPIGYLDIDDIRIDSNIIEPHNDTSMILNSYTGNDIIINTTNLDVNTSGIGVVSLDNIKIKNNKIYTEVASDLLIESDQVNKNIIIKTLIGTTQFDSSIELFDSKTITLGEDLNQKINLDSTKAIGTQIDSVYIRTNNHINFFKDGSHSDTKYDSGGGTLLAAITYNDEPSPSVDGNSRFYAGRVFNAVYNDLAECWYKKYNESINYYEVAVQTINGVVKSSKRAQRGTIGVVSDTYGYILGTEDFNENLSISKKVPIAISGRAKVRVATSKIDIGDELISFKDGFAIKANWFEKIFKRDRIIGRVDSFLETDLIIMKVV